MERDDLPGRAAALGQQLTEGLMSLPRVTGVRGMGGMLAAELEGEISRDIAAAAADVGLLVNPITPTALRLTPPLTTTEAEVDEALGLLRKVLT